VSAIWVLVRNVVSNIPRTSKTRENYGIKNVGTDAGHGHTSAVIRKCYPFFIHLHMETILWHGNIYG